MNHKKDNTKLRNLLAFAKSLFSWLEKSFFGKVLRWIISLFLVTYLIIAINWQNVIQTFKSLNLLIILLALVINFIVEYFSIKRHQLILRQLNVAIPLWQMIRFYFFGMFASLFLPAGSDISKFLLLKTRNNVQMKTSAISLIYDRLIGLLGLTVVLSFSVIFAGIYHLSFIQNWFVWFSIVFLLLLILAFARGFKKNKDVVWPYLYCLFLSIAYQFLIVVIVYLIALAIKPGIEIRWYFISVPIITFGAMLPISIGGLGVREWLFIFFATYLGLSKEAALSVSLILWIFLIFEGLSGLIIYNFGKEKWQKF